MVDENLAEKCRRWVEGYCQPNEIRPQNTAKEVRNRTERRYEIPTCWFERPSWVGTDYHLVKVTNVEAEINVKSRLGKFDTDSLDEIFGQFGECDIK